MAISRSIKVAYSYSSNPRPVQVVYANEQHKDFVKFCNTLRCPLCGSQLDGNIHAKKAQLYCVLNNDEYKIHWIPGDTAPDFELINFYYTQYQYTITAVHNKFGQFDTVIYRYNMDAHPNQRFKTQKKVFEFTGDRLLFFRCRMNEDVFLKKLKLYNVFS
jgi:hypothetical protein